MRNIANDIAIEVASRSASFSVSAQISHRPIAVRGCERFKGGTTLIYESSDSCEGTASAAVGAETRCDQLSGRAWSVRVDGVCSDIRDTSASEACASFKGGSALVYPDSDSCQGAASAAIGPYPSSKWSGTNSVE